MNYFEMYRDVWNFHKQYFESISGSDEFWEIVIEKTNNIAKKYNNCNFICDLLLVEITELERLCKEMQSADRRL